MRLFGYELRRIQSDDQSDSCQNCDFDGQAFEELRKTVVRLERMVYRNRKRYPDDEQNNDNDLDWLKQIKGNGIEHNGLSSLHRES